MRHFLFFLCFAVTSLLTINSTIDEKPEYNKQSYVAYVESSIQDVMELQKKAELELKKEKPKPRPVIGCYGCFATGTVTASQVRRDLLTMIAKYERYWSTENVNNITAILVFAHNHPHFRIDYKLLLAFFGHESWMDINNTSKRNRNGSVDYGLGQHNSQYYRVRFAKAIKLEKKYDIVPGRTGTMNPHDPITGAVSTVLYVKQIRDALIKRRGAFTRRHMILAYNLGLNGMLSGKRNPAYHKQILLNYSYMK